MNHRKIILSMQITLDGYVAGPKGEGDWVQTDDDEWIDLFKDLASADTFLLGRIMYPEYSAYWQSVLKKPDSSNYELQFARLAEKTQHIVFSKSDFVPDWSNTRVAHDIKAETEALKRQEGKNIIAWGGSGFASSLINLGVLDEVRIAVNPIILGDGRSIFDNVDGRRKLVLTDSKPLKGGMVVNRYSVL